MNFDTSSIPATAFPEYAKINLYSCSATEADANESLILDFSPDHTLASGDQYPDKQPGRFGSALVSQFGSAPNPTACILNWSGGGGAVASPFTTTTISGTVPGVTVAGTTTVQLKVANRSTFPSSPAPAGQNGIYLTGYAATQNYRPSLEVTWALPVPAPVQVSPQPGALFTMTPTLSLQSESDPDGDAPVYYLMAVYNTATITQGTQMWSTPQWQTATSAVVPAGVLLAGTNYWWEGCAWDHIDLTSECTGLLGPFTTPQTLPTPVQVSPANGAVVAASPVLVANPVTDPNRGGVVTYAFRYATNPALSGATTTASTSPSLPTSGLTAATTYYWSVSAQDQYGMSSPASPVWSFHIQPPAPSISASIAADPTWTATTTVTVSWSDTSPVAGYTWAFDHFPATDPGTSAPTSTTQATQAVSTGVWYAHVRAVDAAGAWSAIATQQYDIAPMSCATCTAASVDGAGLKSFYPYRSFALGGDATAYANLANGNLVVQDSPLSLPGMGLNLLLEATYNLDRDPATPGATDTVAAGPLGPGWTLAISEGADASAGMLDAPDMVDIGRGLTTTATNAFDFYDASGTHQVFYADAAGWHSPPGINLTLSSGSDGFGPWYRLVRPDGVVYEYRAVQGNGFRLSSISDIKGDYLVFSYAPAPGFPSGQLTSVSEDAAGQAPRSLTFTWSGTSLTKALYSEGGPTEETDFGFDGSGRLSMITRAGASPDAVTTGFGYTASGLASVSDPDGHTSSFGVTSGRLTQFLDRAAEPWGIAYGGPGCAPDNGGVAATCVTEPGVATPTVYSLSAQANMVASRDAGDTDAAGHPRTNLTTYAWAANRLQATADPAGNSTSYAYNAYGQVTQAVHAGAGPTLTTTVSYQAVTPTGTTEVSWLGALAAQVTVTATGVSELTSATSGVGTPAPRTQSFAYNPDTTLASATDPTMATTNFGYLTTVTGHPLASVTDPNRHTTAYASYDPSGQPGMITDASMTVTSLGYDFLGDLTSSTNTSLGLVTRHAYNLRGDQVSTTDPAGSTTLSCFDHNDT